MTRPSRTRDDPLLDALRGGDERAFVSIVERHHAAMVRVARAYVGSAAIAEEVAQEAWVGVIRGIDSFEGRSSLSTWIFAILVNQAKTRAERERRTIPFSTLFDPGPFVPSVEPGRFLDEGHPKWPRWWREYPRPVGDVPEERLLAKETLGVIKRAIADLPPGQAVVITLRDIEGRTSEEVCSVLDIHETNQRVLLHRARSRVRQALERHLQEERTE